MSISIMTRCCSLLAMKAAWCCRHHVSWSEVYVPFHGVQVVKQPQLPLVPAGSPASTIGQRPLRLESP